MYQSLPLLSALLIALASYLLGSQLFGFFKYYWQKYQPHHISKQRFWKFVERQSVHPVIAYLLGSKKIAGYLETAGLKPEWTLHRILALKKVLVLPSLFLSFVWYFLFSDPYIALVFPLVLLVGPQYYLASKSQARKLFATKSLAQIIDLLKLQASIGLNLESSIENIARSRRDLWGSEFMKIQFELDAGLPLENVLERFSKRFNVDDLNRFVLAIKQSKQLGASLSRTLAIQAEALRTRRKQRAEEQARLASVKISFPLVMFIFPALLIIYIAPAVLQIMELG